MTIDRLDNEYSSFILAQRDFEDQTEVTMEITSSLPLRQKIDPLRLQGKLDRIREAKFFPGQREYLQQTGKFTEEFLDYLSTGLPPVKVLAKGDNMKVIIKGFRSDVVQWRVPISIQLHELYYASVIQDDNLNANVLVDEAFRRLRTKADLLRNSGVRFVEAGTPWRYGVEWYALLVGVLIGDVGENIQGTTNMAMAMSTGLPPIANLHPDVALIDQPSLRDLEDLLDGEGRPVVATGSTAFQMAHLSSHVGSERVLFEWGMDCTADMGPGRVIIPLNFVTR